MYSFKKFYLLNEAIPIDTAKNLIQKTTTWDYKTGLNEIFGDKYRLVIGNLSDDSINIRNILSSGLYQKIQNFIDDNTDYRIPSARHYIEGYAVWGGTGRRGNAKIGRLLNKYAKEQKEITNSKGEKITVNILLHEFNNDPLRQISKKPFTVVVSKHPYDVMGASTDRNWTSCMDMGTTRIVYKDKKNLNKYPEKVEGLIQHPTLIAYLVDPNDVNKQGKLQIKRPLSRILIYPFRNKSGEYAWSIGDTYGINNDDFFVMVKEWVMDNLNKDVDANDIYKRIPELYYDSYDEEMVKTYDHYEDIHKKYKETIKEIQFGEIEDQYDGTFTLYDVILPGFVNKQYLQKYGDNIIPYIEQIVNKYLIYHVDELHKIFGEFADDVIYRIWDSGDVHLNVINIDDELLKIEDVDESEWMDEYGPYWKVEYVFHTLQQFQNVYNYWVTNLNDKLESYFERLEELAKENNIDLSDQSEDLSEIHDEAMEYIN